MSMYYEMLISLGRMDEHKHKKAAIRFESGSDEFKYLNKKFDPDDVRIILNQQRDMLDRLLLEYSIGLQTALDTRAKRRRIFKKLTGELGLHILKEIETKEGWYNGTDTTGTSVTDFTGDGGPDYP